MFLIGAYLGFAIGIILMVDIRLISEYRRLKKGD